MGEGAPPVSPVTRVLDHFFFLRPLLLAPAGAMVVLGHHTAVSWTRARGGLLGHGSAAPSDAPGWGIAAGVALIAALVATHVANQVTDAASDAANDKLPHLARGIVSRRAAQHLWATFLAASLAAALLAGPMRGLVLAAALLGAAYSLPPLCLKRRAGWDLAANAAGYGGLAYALGWGLVDPAFRGPVIAQAAPWMLAVGAVFTATAIVDEPGDRAAGYATIAVRLGPRRCRALAVVLLAVAALTAFRVGAKGALWLSLASLPAMCLAVVRPSARAESLAYQVGAALPVLWAALLAPLFGVALGLVALASRLYYGRRFGRAYPHLGEAAGARPAERAVA